MTRRGFALPITQHAVPTLARNWCYPPLRPPRGALRGGDSAKQCLGLGHAGKRHIRVAFAVFLTCLFINLLAGVPRQAFASSTVTFANGATATQDGDGKIEGRAHLTFTSTEGIGATYFKATLPDGQTLDGHCISPGHYIPLDGNYAFTATPNGGGSYSVVVWSSASSGYNPISAPSDINPPQNVGGITWTPKLAGWIVLQKASASTGISSVSSVYSLEGAEYGIYSDSACTVEVGRMTTNSQGKATSKGLASGLYYVKEIKPSYGYALSNHVSVVSISEGKGSNLSVSEPPCYAQPSLLLTKVDADTNVALPQGSAALNNAIYSLKFYGGYYTLDTLPSSARLSLRFKTDVHGQILLDRDYCTYNSSDLVSLQGNLVLPLGTYVFEEVTPSEGYLSSSPKRYLVQVKPGGVVQLVHTYSAPTDSEQVIRGGVRIQKRDAESHAVYPLGSGSFEGITFQIINRSRNSIVVNGASYAPGDVCSTITTDEHGVAQTGATELPYGSYEIVETGHGRGYWGNSDWSQSFEISNQGEIVSLDAVGTAVENQVRRGDISFSKHDSESGALMPGVPFLMTSLTTGEAHVLVTDENGMLSTAVSWNRHTASTNANDTALIVNDDGTYEVDETKLDYEAGVWFGRAMLDDQTTTITPADDTLGALPYDCVSDGGGYLLQELPCAANSGHRMITTTISVARDGVTLDLGTFDDTTVELSTTLTNQDGMHVAPTQADTVLTDTLRYEGLVVGNTYTISGELHAFSADGTDLGVVSTSSIELTPTESNGTISLDFTLDTSEMGGQKVVAFETLLYNGLTWATHANPDDEDQSIYIPKLETVAHGTETLDDDVAALENVGVFDIVSYAGLQPADGYELYASLHCINADGSEGDVVGEGSVVFDARTTEGSVRVSLEDLDLRAYGGQNLVMYEELVHDGQVWATHKDITSQSQTVMVPHISTSVRSAREDGLITTSSNEPLIDVVTYENLLPETVYQLKATLHLVKEEDGEPADGGVLITSDPVTFTTPAARSEETSVSGTVEVPFSADLSGLDGSCVVVFEELSHGDVVVACHEDISDINQTIAVPTLHTTATHEGDHDAFARMGQTIVDVVRYENLTPGLTYTLTGTLMGFSSDNVEEADVTSLGTITKEFTAEQASGSLELEFENIDLSALAGGKVVAYEVLTVGETIVTSHQNPNDAEQTIFIPHISTTAKSSAGTHTALAGSNQMITDTISYENLLPDHTYTATATLHSVRIGFGGAKLDSGAITDPVTVSFVTPAAKEGSATVSGTVDVSVHAYLSDLAGTDVVCFEEISRGETVVANHNDPSDEYQTVHLPRISTSAHANKPNNEGVVSVIDHIEYENLVPGEEYEVVGTLHLKSDAGEDLGVVELEEGKPLTAGANFTLQKANGSIDVEFSLNVADLNLAGKSIVVFEELRQNDVIVARHNEIGSAEQLVVFDEMGIAKTGARMPQTGFGSLPYVALSVLALISLASGIITSKRYS